MTITRYWNWQAAATWSEECQFQFADLDVVVNQSAILGGGHISFQQLVICILETVRNRDS